MPRVNALINKETLAYICSQIGITSTYLAKRTNFAEETIEKWLDTENKAVPTINQAKALARVLKIPFAGLYMCKEQINLKHLPKIRNLRTMPDGITIDDSALNLAIVELIRAQEFLHSTEKELGLSNVPITLPVMPDNASPADYARTIRSFFEIELGAQFKATSARQFYLYVRQKVENKGIFIHCFTGVAVEAVRGISIFNEMNPIIGVNDADRYPAKTFTIIHELVHILKRQSTLCNDMYSSFPTHSEEVFCNAVAGETLVPADALTAYIKAHAINTISIESIEAIAKRFNVSREVINRRFFDTGRYSKDVYDKFANEIRQSFEQEREAAKMARQQGQSSILRNISREAIDRNSVSFCRVLFIGYCEGVFSKQDISGILGIKEKHVPKFISEVARW